MAEFKSGFVSLIGRPNVGKSTLLNRMVGEKIAIISNKPQTTRNNVLGIMTEDDIQIVFTDTPGIHAPATKLGEFMVKSAQTAMRDVDAVLFLVEPIDNVGRTEEKIIEDLKKSDCPVILVINKIDKIKREELFSIITKYTEKFDFHAVVPISAQKKDGIDLLRKELYELIPEGPMFYPEDMVTDQPERQLVAETIREKILRNLDKEVPHGIAIEIMKMKDKGKTVEIIANIYCEKMSHKGILIGKNGEMMKKIGQLAREDMEKMLDKKVYLELWVKVKEDWRNRDSLIRNFGYDMNE
ncbi:MAG: GTPase Era [Clostridia bacterium]|nr:GTPase Era [Clostridia bacterium]